MSSQIKQYLLHFSLFAVTFVTTTLAGAEFTFGKPIIAVTTEGVFVNWGYTWADFAAGLPYSICFLSILTAHEFGHYFVALYYRVKVTLPYYIPLPPGFMLGTMGALIRLKSPVRSTKENFDIGIAGPLAGFVVAVGFLWYGYTHLPPADYVFQFHPEYKQYGMDYAKYVYQPDNMPNGVLDITIGRNLMLMFFESFVGDPARIPNMHEIMHYPFLFAGYLSLVFTCLNLLPIGQLDGGHVLYGLVGFKTHRIIAAGFFILFLFYAGLGFVNPYMPTNDLLLYIPFFIAFLFFCLRGLKLPPRDSFLIALAIFTLQYGLTYWVPTLQGYSGWLLFVFILGTFVGVQHPPCEIEEPLSRGRVILGWLAIVIFILCFTPNPINVTQVLKPTP
ncbi:MAG: site-2 protease family protein [Bacteroidetes bacterium]|nr:site-2 protease family protein [Bacteroidota bacterium]